jgi:hypothetical protein
MTIEPEDVRSHLARQGAAAPAEAAAELILPPSDAEEALLASIAASYFWLRVGLASLAFAFPILLWFFAGGELLRSISIYYHAPSGQSGLLGREPRDVFVGILCAIGAFLYLYKGYKWQENVALNVAGIAAAAVALFPTDPSAGGPVTLHGAAAIAYFLCVAYVCLFRARDTLALVADPGARRRYGAGYKTLGAAMVLLPAAVAAIHGVHRLAAEAGGMVFWLELAAIYVFAAFWTVKSLEIRRIQRQRRDSR